MTGKAPTHHAARCAMTRRDVKQGRCRYCGARCDGTVCAAHSDLPAVDKPVNSVDNPHDAGKPCP